MKIRSITSFTAVHPDTQTISDDDLRQLANFNGAISKALAQSEYELQSLRCATNPFPQYLNKDIDHAVQVVKSLETAAHAIGFDYLSIGTAFVEDLEYYSLIPDVLAETGSVFATAHMTSFDQPVISVDAIKVIADIMKALSQQDENGFGNLYFAALAKVPGGIPFLPSAYKIPQETGLSFALAMESADLAVQSFTAAKTLEEAGRNYAALIEQHASQLEEMVSDVANQYEMNFLGFDFTPAPFVALESSAGSALEQLTGKELGHLSSVSAAAFLMSWLDQANFKRSGFNGLMLPVLEDSVLAQRTAEGGLSLKDLLLYSTVCGTGLDTVPLPGDITEQQLQAILLDVASLAVRLNKPLTARLMPVPEKKAGQMTSFDFPFFTNSAVMSPECTGLSGLFSSASSFSLKPRNK